MLCAVEEGTKNADPAVLRAGTWGVAGAVVAVVLTAAAVPLGLSDPAAIVPVAVVVGAVLATGRVVRDREVATTLATQRHLRSRLDRVEAQLEEIAAIAAFSGMDMPYPLPLGGGWALSWDAAVLLAREVATGRPRTVVELGSGGSSLVIGLQLRRSGQGHLYTLDHDPAFAATTRRHVSALGLDPWVTVLDAPLEPQPVADETYRWYRLPAAVRDLEHIDLVVVDGPPQATDREGMPRYPAVPLLADRLGPGSVLFVDDAFREAEERMLERWRRDEPRWVVETVKTKRGTAIVRWVEPG